MVTPTMTRSIALVGMHVADKVEQQHHQDGEAAHPVEHRQMSLQVKRAGSHCQRPRLPSVPTWLTELQTRVRASDRLWV